MRSGKDVGLAIVDGASEPADEDSCAIVLAAAQLDIKSVKAILIENDYDD